MSLGFTQEAVNYFGTQGLQEILQRGYNARLVTFLNMRAHNGLATGERFYGLSTQIIPKVFMLSFLSGIDEVNVSTPDELASAVLGDAASSMVVWGDIRDLGDEMLASMGDGEVDWVTFAMAAVGLAAEVGWLNPFPDVLDYVNVKAALMKAQLKQMVRHARTYLAKSWLNVIMEKLVKVIGRGPKHFDFVGFRREIEARQQLAAFLVKNPQYQNATTEQLDELLDVFMRYGDGVSDLRHALDDLAKHIRDAGVDFTPEEFLVKATGDSTLLSAEEKALIKKVRDLIPTPDASTWLTKTLSPDDLDKLLNGENWTEMGGYLARAQDTIGLHSPSEAIRDLALLYTLDNGTMPFLNAQRVGVVKFKTAKLQDPTLLKVPYGGVIDDQGADWIPDAVKQKAPFTGTGYTQSYGKNLIPEWQASRRMAIDDGAELWIIEEGQPPKLAMIFKGGTWIVPPP